MIKKKEKNPEVEEQNSVQPAGNIYQSLKKNFITTWLMVGACTIISLSSIVFAYKTYVYQMNHVLTLDPEGDVKPLEMVNRDKVIKIECLDHMSKWFGSYYTYDQNNVDEQRERGLWYIDTDDGKKLEDFYKQKRWFDDVKKFNIKQTSELLPEEVVLDVSKKPYRFKAVALTSIRQGDELDYYKIYCTGVLKEVSRDFPKNPHGLMIDNYEEKKVLLKDYKEEDGRE